MEARATNKEEQLEYMITEDDDAPLLTADDNMKQDVKECVNRLFSRSKDSLIALSCDSTESLSEAGNTQLFQSYLTDLSDIKLEIMRELAEYWFDASEKIVKVLEQGNSTIESLR